MTDLVRFFSEINKLKATRRRGWAAHHIDPAESTASHSFRLAMMAWVLSGFKNLKSQKLIKMALIHDICKVYCFDATPYDPLLPKDLEPGKTKEILRSWPKLSPSEKTSRKEAKYQDEYEGLKKITSYLPLALREEIINLWQELEYREKTTGAFIKQADKVENFFQGVEYWQAGAEIQIRLWLRWIKEIIDDQILVKFKKAISRHFLKNQSLNKEPMDQTVLFLIEVGKLKLIPKQEWVSKKVEKPETVAEHSFNLALMAWILGQGTKLDINKMIKMALIYDLAKIRFDEEKIHKGGMNHLIKEKKAKRLGEKKKNEEVFKKLIDFLPLPLQEEIALIYQDFNNKTSKESHFVHQLIKIVDIFQAKQYKKENPHFSLDFWFAELDKKIDHPVLLKLLSKIKED